MVDHEPAPPLSALWTNLFLTTFSSALASEVDWVRTLVRKAFRAPLASSIPIHLNRPSRAQYQLCHLFVTIPLLGEIGVPALHSSKAQFGHFLQEEFTGPINPHPDSLERKAEEFSGFRLRAVFQGCQDKGTFEFVGQYVDRLFQRDEFLLAVCFLIWPMFS